MIESLLLCWIDAKTARTAIGRRHDLIAVLGANEAEGALTLVKLAKELSPIFGDGLKDQAAAVWG